MEREIDVLRGAASEKERRIREAEQTRAERESALEQDLEALRTQVEKNKEQDKGSAGERPARFWYF